MALSDTVLQSRHMKCSSFYILTLTGNYFSKCVTSLNFGSNEPVTFAYLKKVLKLCLTFKFMTSAMFFKKNIVFP